MTGKAIFISPRELCDRWGRRISEKTLSNWRQEGRGPAVTRLGGRVAFRVADVEEYEARPGFDAWLRRRRGARPPGGRSSTQ